MLKKIILASVLVLNLHSLENEKSKEKEQKVDSKTEESTKENKDSNVEKNGFFAGGGIGIGQGGAHLSFPFLSDNGSTSQTIINYDTKFGYKYFFNEWFGIRGYINIGHLQTWNKVSLGSMIPNNGIVNQDYNMSIIDYNLNLDLICNVYNDANHNVGFFIGAGAGAMNAFYKDQHLVDKNFAGFQTNVKLGIRIHTNNHGMELVAALPLLKIKTQLQGNAGQIINAAFNQNYIISSNYTYSFDFSSMF